MTNDASGQNLVTGAVVFLLLSRPASWVHRRVESIRFVDDRTVERRVSLDFTPPDGLPPISCIPLALLRKEKLRNFDLRSADERSVPILTRQQNGTVAFESLLAQAETTIGKELSTDVRRELELIARGRRDEASAALKRLRESSDSAARDLAANRPLMAYARQLAENFILLAAAELKPGVRAVFKFCYEETIPKLADTWMNRLIVWLGWRRFPMRFGAPAVGDSSSYHFEVEAPQDVEISAANLRAEHTELGGSNDWDGGEVQRAHLYLSDVPYGSDGEVSLLLRARRAGFLLAALATAFLAAALLAGGRVALSSVVEHFGTAVTVLVILPGLLVAYLVRPGEHALVTRLLAGVRMLVLIAGACSVVAASILVGGVRDAWLCSIWGVLAAFAGAMFLGVLLSNLLPRPIKA